MAQGADQPSRRPARPGAPPARPRSGPQIQPSRLKAASHSAAQPTATTPANPTAKPTAKSAAKPIEKSPAEPAADAPAKLTAQTQLTGRGAASGMFGLFFLGLLVSDWAHLEVLAGLSFVAGCALAARYTKRDGLLTVVASPPLLFAIGLIITEAFSSHAAGARRTVESLAEGIILTLAGVAPWLFAGMVIGVIIAMFRGLPQCFRDLAAELRGDPPATSRPARPGEHRTST